MYKRIFSIVLAVALVLAFTSCSKRASDESTTAGNTTSGQAGEAIDTTPVAMHGRLSTADGKIVDENGEVFVIKGVSSHGINWDIGYPFVNESSLKTLRDEWGVNAFRVVMYTEDYNGYCVTDSDSQNTLLGIIDDAVEACNSLGIYVIIDWHILLDGNPNTHLDEAKVFFSQMSEKYKSYSNVLFEICNEPNGGTTWDDVKAYANTIIPIIRANTDNIIIVGTPNWCQDVDIAAESPIEGFDNLAYTIHFYAATHDDWLRDKVKKATKNKLPLICTEFNACEASGDGSYNFDSLDKWMKLFDNNDIGRLCWSLSNKDESASLLKPNVTKTADYTPDDLTEMGSWLVENYNK